MAAGLRRSPRRTAAALASTLALHALVGALLWFLPQGVGSTAGRAPPAREDVEVGLHYAARKGEERDDKASSARAELGVSAGASSGAGRARAKGARKGQTRRESEERSVAPMPPEVGAGLAPGGDGLALAIPGEGAPGEENQREVAEGEGAGVGAERGGLGGLGGGRAGEGFGGAMGDGNATSIAAEEDALLARIARRLARQTAGCYPRGAMRTKLMGTVRLSFCIDAEGVPAEAAIRESSGSDLLDRAALECVLARAAPLPIIRRCLVLPVEFRLKSR